MRIVLDDIEMNTGEPDANGSLWYVSELDGWDGPPVRGGVQDYAQKDGGAPSRASYGSRALVLKGICKTIGEAGFWASYNRLMSGIGILARTVDLTVAEEVDKSLLVRLEGPVRRVIRPGHFEFEVPLMAANPVKYGPEQTIAIPASATRTITNTGNYPSDGVMATISGSGKVNLTHQEQSRSLTTGSATVEGGTVLNMRERSIRYDGADRYSALAVTSNWWTLNPGPNRIENRGASSVSVRYRPAWV